MKFSVKDILEICDGRLICGSLDVEISQFSKDTRTIKKGDCYVGIKGETFDGNSYWQDAKEKGAIACIVDSFSGSLKEEETFPIILVKDSVKALQSLAAYVRSKLNIPVIAITGSAGKTSTKDMISEVLKQKYKVLKSPGNLNGQIGLPLTILSYQDEDVMVLEMGMNEFHQIENLSNTAKPTIAVITNIGSAHIGILGSRENILKAKLEILKGMKENTPVILNNDNDLLQKLKLDHHPIITCGIENESDYQAVHIKNREAQTSFEVTGKVSLSVTLPVMGNVFVSNSLLAIAVGKYLEVPEKDIKKALEQITLSDNRMRIVNLKKHITMIDDSYNSNFEALASALKILSEKKGKRKIAILGDILEMEEFSEEIHRKIATLDSIPQIDAYFLCGSAMKYVKEELEKQKIDCFWFPDTKSLKEALLSYLKEEDTILLKASKAMHFKELAEEIENEWLEE